MLYLAQKYGRFTPKSAEYWRAVNWLMRQVVDMACWPRVSRPEWQGIDLTTVPNVRDWYLHLADRPAVQRSRQAPKFVSAIPMP